MKEILFKPLHWIMLILISLDFIDTTYRITYGYFSGQGVQPPIGEFNVQISTLDFSKVFFANSNNLYKLHLKSLMSPILEIPLLYLDKPKNKVNHPAFYL